MDKRRKQYRERTGRGKVGKEILGQRENRREEKSEKDEKRAKERMSLIR